MKGSICQEDITTINIYAPNNRSAKYTKQKANRIERRNRQINNYSMIF